jgi:hypothetical protein
MATSLQWANRRLYDMSRFPHARSNSAGVPRQAGAQEPPRGRLFARDVDLGGREEFTGDVITSGVDFVVKEGKIQLVRRILCLEWLKPCRPGANKTLLTGDA